jgi:hypothetical protein
MRVAWNRLQLFVVCIDAATGWTSLEVTSPNPVADEDCPALLRRYTSQPERQSPPR